MFVSIPTYFEFWLKLSIDKQAKFDRLLACQVNCHLRRLTPPRGIAPFHFTYFRV